MYGMCGEGGHFQAGGGGGAMGGVILKQSSSDGSGSGGASLTVVGPQGDGLKGRPRGQLCWCSAENQRSKGGQSEENRTFFELSMLMNYLKDFKRGAGRRGKWDRLLGREGSKGGAEPGKEPRWRQDEAPVGFGGGKGEGKLPTGPLQPRSHP